MCGIVGLHLKGDRYTERLGELLTGMLTQVRERGPDSAGVGVYGPEGLKVLKGVGDPAELAVEFGLAAMSGYQAVGHTRMATESAITVEGSHPFSPRPGLCLVHNGSFANHATIRRELEAEGVVFETENDSEVAARFVGHRLDHGDDLDKALRLVCDRFDGFYTLLVSTDTEFAVVRDAVACKPAILAETDAWVAMVSEYRALVGLPGFENARVFEPGPEEVHLWRR